MVRIEGKGWGWDGTLYIAVVQRYSMNLNEDFIVSRGGDRGVAGGFGEGGEAR